jgi:Fic family protein
MKPYLPEPLPLKKLDYRQLIKIVGRANAELARYDGLLRAVVNPEILLSPMITKEAVLSSKIEGTQATLDEVLRHEAGIPVVGEQKIADIQEIVNYRSTLILAEKALTNRPMTLFLLRQMHKELMTSVRGQHKNPGEFRRIQNWIGPTGGTIARALFIPPEPVVLQEHLSALEKYMQVEDVDDLIQCAVVHAQFELLHPFLDGNGRIGRLLIPLFLYFKKRLIRPMFYMSEYLENQRNNYYAKLNAISRNGEWNEWIDFFLRIIHDQALRNSEKVTAILDLHRQLKDQIYEITHSRYSLKILDALFFKPVFPASDLMLRTKIVKQTLMPILRKLRQAGILKVIRPAQGRRPAVMAFTDLLNITEDPRRPLARSSTEKK